MRIKYSHRSWRRKFSFRGKVMKMMKCICSRENLRVDDEIIPSSESLATRDYSASGFSSRAGENDTKADATTIEQAESMLRESEYLNYEEARALLGRLEFHKGNTEAALGVFEGIDVAAVTAKIKISLSKRDELPRRHSLGEKTPPPMSMHAVSLLFEAILLKAKSLSVLGRFAEAALSCKVITDTVESAVPDGLAENFASDFKLLDILRKSVELLPELWKLAHEPEEAILSYRKGLLYQWNLDLETRAKLEKGFATFLLYSGSDATAPNLRFQTEGCFVPRNNTEEAILLLLILLRKILLKKIGWDPSVMDHLCYALSISGEFSALAHVTEELPPSTLEEKQKHSTLALCYYAQEDDMVALNLLRNIFSNRESRNNIFKLLLASKICGDKLDYPEEGIEYARKVLSKSYKCNQIASVANFLLGISLSAQSKKVDSDSLRIIRQSEALEAFETARAMTKGKTSSSVLFYLSLENAEQRKLEIALYYVKQTLKLEAGSDLRGWILLARILSAQKNYIYAENVVNAALEETGKWDQGELLRTKAKLQIIQGHLKEAIETFTRLLALLHVQAKTFGMHNKLLRNNMKCNKNLEMETWHDLANIYTSLSQWRDAEVCLLKSEAINPHSASRLHSKGTLYEGRGLHNEALKFYKEALEINPNHVPSLISIATLLRQYGGNLFFPIVKSFLFNALRLDRTNPSVWYNLGLLYKQEDGCSSALEAAECFEAAVVLHETAPVQPFR